MKRPSTGNAIAGVCILVLVVASFFASFDVLDTSGTSDPGPAAYPRIILAMIAICSLTLFTNRDLETEDSKQNKHGNIKTVLILLLLIAVYVFLLQYIGYIVSTALFICAALILAKEKRPLVIVFYAVAFSLIIYFVFSNYLNVVLPVGLVEELIG